MKHALCLSALLMTTSVTALAAPVTYDFTGELTSISLTYQDASSSLSFNPDPNAPLTIDNTEFLDGNPNVVGTITYDPDFQGTGTPLQPVPVTFSFSLEGFTVTRPIGFSGFDTFVSDETSLDTNLESYMQSTGPILPFLSHIDLNLDNGIPTDGTFRFGELTGPNIILGNMEGTISSLTPVPVPEPGAFALLLTGLASIWVTMRRRGGSVASSIE